MKKTIQRFSHPLRGILYALRNDRSYRSQVYGVGAVVLIVFYVFEPLEMWEAMFIVLAYTLILITELQNSALEEALDRMHPEMHEKIGRSKDMAAGAVLIAGGFLLLVILLILLGRV